MNNGRFHTLSTSVNAVLPCENSAKASNKVARIKRPLNRFMVWAKEERKIVQKQNPGLVNSAISKLLGAKWRSMSAEEKAPYEARAKKLDETHKLENPGYKYQPKRKQKATSYKKIEKDYRANTTCSASRIIANTASFSGPFSNSTGGTLISWPFPHQKATSSKKVRTNYRANTTCPASRIIASTASFSGSFPHQKATSSKKVETDHRANTSCPASRVIASTALLSGSFCNFAEDTSISGSFPHYTKGPACIQTTQPFTSTNPPAVISSQLPNSEYYSSSSAVQFPAPELSSSQKNWPNYSTNIGGSADFSTVSSTYEYINPQPPIQPLSELEQYGDFYNGNRSSRYDEITSALNSSISILNY